MPLDFPSSPEINDTYTSGNSSWVWDGSAWESVVDPIEHGSTTGRDAVDQHTIGSITGLNKRLELSSLAVDGVMLLDDYDNPTQAIALIPAPGVLAHDGIAAGWQAAAELSWEALLAFIPNGGKLVTPFGENAGVYSIVNETLEKEDVYPGFHVIWTSPVGQYSDLKGILFLPYNNLGVGGITDREQLADKFYGLPIADDIGNILPYINMVHDGIREEGNFWSDGPGSIANSTVVDSVEMSPGFGYDLILLINQPDGNDGVVQLKNGFDPTQIGNEPVFASFINSKWGTLHAGSIVYVGSGDYYGGTCLAPINDLDGFEGAFQPISVAGLIDLQSSLNSLSSQVDGISDAVDTLSGEVGDITTELSSFGHDPKWVSTGGTAKITTSATLEDISGITADVILGTAGKITASFCGAVYSFDNIFGQVEIILLINNVQYHAVICDALADGSRHGFSLSCVSNALVAGTYQVKAQFRRSAGSGQPALSYCSLTAFALPG